MYNSQNRFGFKGQRCQRTWALISVLLVSSVSINLVRAQDRCVAALSEATKAYDAGLVTAAIALLTQCLPDGIPENERTRAYRLLAYCCLADDDQKGADAAVEKLLKHDSTFKPDAAEDKPQFTALVEAVRQRLLSQQPFVKKMLRKKWFVFGGGGLLTAGLVAVLASGNKATPDPDLPVPPDLP